MLLAVAGTASDVSGSLPASFDHLCVPLTHLATSSTHAPVLCALWFLSFTSEERAVTLLLHSLAMRPRGTRVRAETIGRWMRLGLPAVRADWSLGASLPSGALPLPVGWSQGHGLVGKFTQSLFSSARARGGRGLLRASAATLSYAPGKGGLGQDRTRSHHRSVEHPATMIWSACT